MTKQDTTIVTSRPSIPAHKITSNGQGFAIEQALYSFLELLRTPRQREVVARHAGLFGDKETLKALGQSFDTTTQNVHDMYHRAMAMLRSSVTRDHPRAGIAVEYLREELERIGGTACLDGMALYLGLIDNDLQQRRLRFAGDVSPGIYLIKASASHYEALSLRDPAATTATLQRILNTVQTIGEPGATTEQIVCHIKSPDLTTTREVAAFASLSKQLAFLDERWMLTSWPLVSPQNLEDRIYVVLHKHGRPLHYTEIARRVKLLRKPRCPDNAHSVDNRLIADPRFVAVGRGLYALREWGYPNGAIADVITDALRQARRPLSTEEIVAWVLERRHTNRKYVLDVLSRQPQFECTTRGLYLLNQDAAYTATASKLRHRLKRK